MSNDLITKSDEQIVGFFNALDRVLEKVKRLAENYRPSLNGERYLSDRELSERLRVSRRTLQDYRNEGLIPYYQLGGKLLYRESEIEELLRKHHREAFEDGNRRW